MRSGPLDIPIVPAPPFQTVCDLRAPHPTRIRAAVLAAACDATVCLLLSIPEVERAERMGLRVARTPHAATDALTETGLALLDPRAPAWARSEKHPARPRRVVIVGTHADRPLATAQQLAREDLDAALVVPVDGGDAWQVTGGRVRRARIPHCPAATTDRPEAEAAVAFQAACVLWCARWLPRFDDVHAWTTEKLRRGVDLKPYQR